MRGRRFVAGSLLFLLLLLPSLAGYSDEGEDPNPAKMSTSEIVAELMAINERRAERLNEREKRIEEREIALETREANLKTIERTTTELVNFSRSLSDEKAEAQRSRDRWATAFGVSAGAWVITIAVILLVR